MTTILEAVGDRLVSAGLGTLGSTVFLGVMPESPDAMIAVYESGGVQPSFTMGAAGVAIDKPSLQVICRGVRGDYPGARDLAVSVRNALAAVANETISGVNVLRISPSGSVLPMGPDQNQRPMVSVNFDCMVRL